MAISLIVNKSKWIRKFRASRTGAYTKTRNKMFSNSFFFFFNGCGMWLHGEQLLASVECMYVHCCTYTHGYVVIQLEVLLQLVWAQLHTCFHYTAVLKSANKTFIRVIFVVVRQNARVFLRLWRLFFFFLIQKTQSLAFINRFKCTLVKHSRTRNDEDTCGVLMPQVSVGRLNQRGGFIASGYRDRNHQCSLTRNLLWWVFPQCACLA